VTAASSSRRLRHAPWIATALVAISIAACSSPPSEPPPPTPSPVDEVVEAHLLARGGKEKLRALRSIRETGTITASDGRVARVVREIKRPNLFRLEFTYEGTKSVFAYDGKAGWQVAPLFGRFEPEAMPAENDAAAVEQGDIESFLVDWREKGHTVELVGRERLPSGEAFKLKVMLAGGRTRHDYIDAATHQVVRSDVVRTVDGRQVEIESTFSDFREVGGITFPHAIESHGKDRPQTLRIVVRQIEIDPELDDTRFQMPQ
jgi:outer membrane lipoprotein-sorting protein